MQNLELLIVTGSNLQAERADRPAAYRLQRVVENQCEHSFQGKTLVISDLWYLNCEILHQSPMISLGGPEVNAVSAYLHKRLPGLLMIDNCLSIQMDAGLNDLRACVWGISHKLTMDAIELFINRGYLGQFLEAAKAHHQ